MVLKDNDTEISTVDHIPKVKAGEMKADLVLKVWALLMRVVLSQSNVNSGGNEDVDFFHLRIKSKFKTDANLKYEATMRRISDLG